MAGLRNARSKFGRRGIGIALDDRDLVDEVAQHAGGTHPAKLPPITRALVAVMDQYLDNVYKSGVRWSSSACHPR